MAFTLLLLHLWSNGKTKYSMSEKTEPLQSVRSIFSSVQYFISFDVILIWYDPYSISYVCVGVSWLTDHCYYISKKIPLIQTCDVWLIKDSEIHRLKSSPSIYWWGLSLLKFKILNDMALIACNHVIEIYYLGLTDLKYSFERLCLKIS